MLSPLRTLNVEQTTVFQPLVTTNGTSNSSTLQNLSYNLNLMLKYKLTTLLTLQLNSNYSFLPMKYDLAVLNSSADGFTTETIDIEETTISNIIKISFNIDTFSTELSPSIGYGRKSVSSKDIVSNTTRSLDTNIVMLGFEGRF